jgi:hypothetical protein
METTLENNMEDNSNVNSNENSNELESSVNLMEELGNEYLKKKFKSRLMAVEILTNGIGRNHSILHLGSSYMNGMLFTYISDLYLHGKLDDLDIKYTGVDAKENNVKTLNDINEELFQKVNFNSESKTAQEFLDENRDSNINYDWTVITGIFDKNNYGNEQFKFIDTILSESLNLSKFGTIFTFDSMKENSKNYNIRILTSYLDSSYGRYKISKIDDNIYVICVYKYQYSINN